MEAPPQGVLTSDYKAVPEYLRVSPSKIQDKVGIRKSSKGAIPFNAIDREDQDNPLLFFEWRIPL